MRYDAKGKWICPRPWCWERRCSWRPWSCWRWWPLAVLTRGSVRVLDWCNRKGKSAAGRLVQLTGKSPYRIHPKHLIDAPWHEWYMEHLLATHRVLDVGCGHGAHTLIAAQCVRAIVGVDQDAAQLRVAEKRARDEGIWNVQFLERDLTRSLPFLTGYFDVVLCLDVIEHIEDRQHLLREIHRVLTPTGQLFISAPNRATRWRQRLRDAGLFAFSDPDHRVEYSAEEFQAELQAAGFRAGRLSPVVYDTPLAGWIDAVGGVSLLAYAWLSRWKRMRAVREPGESTGFWCVARKSNIAPTGGIR